MDENTINNQPAEPQAPVQANQGKEEPKFTQDELNEIVSKRVNKVKAKYEADLDEKLTQARTEWERQAKLSDEERLAEAQKQKIEELEPYTVHNLKKETPCFILNTR